MAFPHDQFARRIFRRPDEAKTLLRAALTMQQLSEFDLATLTLVGANLIDDRLSERATDLLFSVSRLGAPWLAYLLLEHKSGFDRWTPLQVLEYKVRIWLYLRDHSQANQALPDILPIVLYHGARQLPREWRLRSLFRDAPATVDFGGPLKLDYGLVVLDLVARSDYSLLAADPTGSPLATLSLLALKSIRQKDLLRQIENWGPPIRALLAMRRGQIWFRIVIRYILDAAPHAPPAWEIRNTMRRIAGSEAGDIVMTTAEKLVAQGRKQGIEQGIEQGINRHRQATIPKILQARFGNIPDNLRLALGKVEDPKMLDQLIEIAATARDIREFAASVPEDGEKRP